MILDGERLCRVTTRKENENISKLISCLIQEEGKNSFDVCAFDGVRQTNRPCQLITSAITNNVDVKTKVVKITSLEFDIKGGDSTGGLDGINSYFALSLWKYDNYEKAVWAELLEINELRRIVCLDLGSEDSTTMESQTIVNILTMEIPKLSSRKHPKQREKQTRSIWIW